MSKNTMAMRQTFWTKSGVFAAGPLRRSQIASAAAKRKGQEDIQLSLESIYSVQRALPSHWKWMRHADFQRSVLFLTSLLLFGRRLRDQCFLLLLVHLGQFPLQLHQFP